MGGEQITSSQIDRLCSLEVYDFLYMFLLSEVVPLAKLGSWIDGSLEDWPYEHSESGPIEKTLKQTISSWVRLIAWSRWSLQPSDLVDLIRNKSWSTGSRYPQDKTQYMRLRGVFDLDADGDMDFYSSITRPTIVGNLQSNNSLFFRDEENPTWWDQVRVKSGSPFIPGFRSRYLIELAKIGDRDDDIKAMVKEVDS